MKLIVKILFLIFSIIFLSYLLLPGPNFPEPPADSITSEEPADIEDDLRKAYFTNFGRTEVLRSYQNEFDKATSLTGKYLSYRLNYPPENAQTIIRDQTRSSYLEEIVHPFRESLFINGFEPVLESDAIFIEGRDWRQKIIVRYVPSNLFVRLLVGLATLGLIIIIYNESARAYKILSYDKKPS